jgi:hypothetical protein
VKVEDWGSEEGNDLQVFVLDESDEDNCLARVSGHVLDPVCGGLVPISNWN